MCIHEIFTRYTFQVINLNLLQNWTEIRHRDSIQRECSSLFVCLLLWPEAFTGWTLQMSIRNVWKCFELMLLWQWLIWQSVTHVTASLFFSIIRIWIIWSAHRQINTDFRKVEGWLVTRTTYCVVFTNVNDVVRPFSCLIHSTLISFLNLLHYIIEILSLLPAYAVSDILILIGYA